MFTGSYGTPRGRRTTAGAMDFNRISPFMSSTLPPHNSATEQVMSVRFTPPPIDANNSPYQRQTTFTAGINAIPMTFGKKGPPSKQTGTTTQRGRRHGTAPPNSETTQLDLF